jgi:PrpF protein
MSAGAAGGWASRVRGIPADTVYTQVSSRGIRCMQMRGGTCRGLYFLAADLPADPAERDALLVAVLGSGHPLQIDGLGGGHSLTSKVAVVPPSRRDDVDVDYLFLQLGVDAATITDKQQCGNILAGVGPSAVERGSSRPTCASDSAPPGSSPAPPCRNCPPRVWWNSSATAAPGSGKSRSMRPSR